MPAIHLFSCTFIHMSLLYPVSVKRINPVQSREAVGTEREEGELLRSLEVYFTRYDGVDV